MRDIYREIAAARDKGEDLVVVTAVDKKGSAPSKIGSKMIVSASKPPVGTVGGGSLERTAVDTAGELLNTRKHLLREYVFGDAEKKTAFWEAHEWPSRTTMNLT